MGNYPAVYFDDDDDDSACRHRHRTATCPWEGLDTLWEAVREKSITLVERERAWTGL